MVCATVSVSLCALFRQALATVRNCTSAEDVSNFAAGYENKGQIDNKIRVNMKSKH